MQRELEIRTGSDGLKTSDWGNDIFIEAAKSVSPGLFVNVGDNKSDRGDRVESLFNISFWTKEGAVDWSWLGLETPGKERERRTHLWWLWSGSASR